MKKNILITGSDGYIGTNLNSYLPKNRYNIFGIDKKTGTPAEILQYLKHYDNIVHLAALPGIKACEDNFEIAVRDNILSAFNIFNLAWKDKIPVIFLSSQAAKDEKSSVYAMMKRTIEIQAKALNLHKDVNIKVLRLTNVYGGIDYLEKKNTVVKKFIKAYRNKETMWIDGYDGSQTRDFIHIDDVCEYILRCIEMNNIKIYEPIDIGTGEQTSIKELAKMFNYDSVKYNSGSRSVGVETNYADITNAINIFGYKAENKLQEYIKEMI